MATGNIWERLRYFNRSENWGVPSKISSQLLLKLDQTRHFLNTPMHVNRGFDPSAAKTSTHLEGKAVDLVLPECRRHPVDILIAIERFDYGGIGYYPHWEFRGEMIGGWHLDVRVREKHTASARWMGVYDKDQGRQIYVALSYKNLVKYGVIK